ncbi:SpiroCoCo family coiled-coil protein [Breznakiella homolactica]|uniref:Chromosome segregation ATPase n=1 Tax=Breznakiella homolactica TaxID=2798577 RepID=A0A7T7XML9_9SPIR|nr:hypothetical protein [Breznakiella homolactica]QQO09028.1 hypothetical protein JFL75_19185 [Breznakiella homolactica]
MSFFTVGNLLTLGIVALVLILYRQLDKNNRSLEKMRKYGEKLKEELGAFVAEKEAAVRDYSVELDVQQKSAKELMKRLVVTDDELAGKAEAVARIDERINSYDASLEELMRMTGRVQENLSRIKDESAFVENAVKRVGDAKSRLESLEKDLSELELRFERENSEALERATEAVTAAVRSAVSDLQASAETIERQVEDHREAVDKIEQQRAASLARDMDIINKTLKEAVERAGSRADKMEEAAFGKLKEQALERSRRFQSAVEEKLKDYQESAKSKVLEVQGLIKTYKDEWKTDHAELETKQKAYRDEWKKDVQELNALAKNQKDTWKKDMAEAERKALEEADSRLEEYRSAQAEQFRMIEALSDDVGRLDGELRRSMQETESRVRQDFGLFEQDSAATRDRVSAEFAASVGRLKTDMDGLEQELNALKTRAYENVSEKLQLFEDDFFADLTKRSTEIDQRLTEWKTSMDTSLAEIAGESIAQRRNLELSFNEELKQRLSDESDRIVAELEHLKAETGAFEEGIREIMDQTDRSLLSLKEQISRDLEDARTGAENAVKSEIRRYELSMAENLKQSQREMEAAVKEIADQVEQRNTEISGMLDASRMEIETWQANYVTQLREAESTVDEARRRARDLVNESDDRLASVRAAIQEVQDEADSHRNEIFSRTEEQAKTLDSAIRDADRRIKEFIAQTKLFDQADELKADLERRIEDLKDDLNRLDQRRSEAAELEGQFVKIKRLEDEVNAKMTRFLSEKRRIELMEADFNRLLQTSQAVEEKLTQVSSSDDILQAMQVQLRRLDDAMADTEEKYQRMEKKNQILDMTNDGIDRNFKVLQETEDALRDTRSGVERLFTDLESIRASVDVLAKENEKAQSAADKISDLDDLLKHIESRIESMQVAREWLARAETRLEEVSKQAQEQVKIMGTLFKNEGRKGSAKDRGAPPIGTRETVVKLAHQGWSVDEIARAVKLSKGEVELILEIAPKD